LLTRTAVIHQIFGALNLSLLHAKQYGRELCLLTTNERSSVASGLELTSKINTHQASTCSFVR